MFKFAFAFLFYTFVFLISKKAESLYDKNEFNINRFKILYFFKALLNFEKNLVIFDLDKGVYGNII